MLQTSDDIKSLGTILGIWAHPDDDTFSMGGIMATAVQNGQTVAIITATRGEAGVQDESRWPAHNLADIRTKEMAKSMQILGVTNHHWLDYPDGGCSQVDEQEAVERIAELLNTYHPDSVLTFGPDGMTGHDDHKTVSLWADKAAKKTGINSKIYHATHTHEQYDALIEADKKFNIFFNTEKPPVCSNNDCAIHFSMSEEIYQKKLAALHAMESQTEGMLKVFEDSLRVSLGTEAFVIAGNER